MDNDNIIDYKKYISTLSENIKLNKEIITNLKNHINDLLIDYIITFDEYNDIIKRIRYSSIKINDIFELLNSLKDLLLIITINDNTKNNEFFDIKFNFIETTNIDIKNEILNIICDYGYLSISQFLFIFNKNLFLKEKKDIEHKLGIFDNYYKIIKINKIISNHKNFNINIKNIDKIDYIENNNIKNNTNIKFNIKYELNKANIEFIFDENLFTLTGYFKEDLLNEIFYNKNFRKKYLNILNKFNEINIKLFAEEYLNQVLIKDFIINEENIIINEINDMYLLYKKIEKLSSSELFDEFNKINIYDKRNIIIILLIDNFSENKIKNDKIKTISNYDEILSLIKIDKITLAKYSVDSIIKSIDSDKNEMTLEDILLNSKKILNANMLINYLGNNILTLEEYYNLINSIHWNLRKKIFSKLNIENKITNEKTNNEWEKKLLFCEISNKAKEKILDKIKEVNNSLDNTKAETFIEGFFKIPFGKYIIEDIFIKSLNSDKKIKKLMNLINDFITDKHNYINISDSIQKINSKISSYNLLDNIKNYYNNLISEIKYINKEKNEYLKNVDLILEKSIHGHFESKREIKRLIAQWMSGNMTGIVLGFHGPPGVGKTCFAQKGIANCLFDSEGKTRPFCIFQLGGATDGTILEGHSYTYSGAKCGRLVEFLQESKCMNPIIYFDELDKVSETEKGKEIINILIHLTDKSQNKEIYDKYFNGIELDFSKCIIIFSYNDASKINKILRDRITEIKINPLKKNEKITITQIFTLKEISSELNFNCELSDELIEYIIDTYTLEPGIRKLNEKLYELFREINLRFLEYSLINDYFNFEINKDFIDEILIRHNKIIHTKIYNKPEIGLVNGLYASSLGLGGITLIQINKILTNSNSIPLELTGKQGDIMKESMLCAKTVAMNLLNTVEKNNVSDELKKKPFGLHIHCPDGSTPKDGPSAGITIAVGIYSILTDKLVNNEIAMTGEIDLFGNVKAIGGLEAKINGAIKAGIKLVIFPKENKLDFEKIIKDKLLEGNIDYYMASNIQEVIEKAMYK